MHATEYKQPWAELLTCLEQYKTRAWPLPQTTHHCIRWGPHDEHHCPCGIRWRGERIHAGTP